MKPAIATNLLQPRLFEIASDLRHRDRYTVRLAADRGEILSALRLRYEVFSVELGREKLPAKGRLEYDEFDFRCRHLVAIDEVGSAVIGTYRLNTIETARSIEGFYSAREFDLRQLPSEVIDNGIEIGRACVALDHRNSKALFKLWKGLLAELERANKRYLFGCCSIFTRDVSSAPAIYRSLVADGFLANDFAVHPLKDAIDVRAETEVGNSVEMPGLFKMYLRLGAKICGPPMFDPEFGSIDFFVVLDSGVKNEARDRLLR